MAGFYINLDRDLERRARMERQLAALGLQDGIQRFTALDGAIFDSEAGQITVGEIGCFQSHLAALRLAQEAGGVAQIIEDDAMLSSVYGEFCTKGFQPGLFNTFDIVLTDVILQPDLQVVHFLKRAIDEALAARASGRAVVPKILEVTRRNFSGAASYLVGSASLDRLIRLLEAECQAGPRMPFDLFLRALAKQGLIRVACVAPFLTCVHLEDIAATTIENRAAHADNPTVLAASLLRYAFYVDGDIDGYARPFLDRVPWPHPTPCGDSRFDMVMKIIAFMLSDRFASF